MKLAIRPPYVLMDRQQRPPSILRFLMGDELYRQARKIGWSRPWNKYGINTFLSFKLDFPQDDDLVERARAAPRNAIVTGSI
jgi:hypothetical protein